MKILVFEYVCGGGFCSDDLPDSLAHEGLLMLKALLDDLAELEEHQITALVDWRFIGEFQSSINIIPIVKTDNILQRFRAELTNVDAVWLIAPESEQVLENLTLHAESFNTQLLSSPFKTIVQTSDKWQTFKQLSKYNIATVKTEILTTSTFLFSSKNVLKSRDGAGCEHCFLINSQKELELRLKKIETLSDYIIQPFVEGNNLSISVLFKQGEAQLLCVNRQHIEIKNQAFKLLDCDVNCEIADKAIFQKLSQKIAKAFPALWGYVGIDLIQTPNQLYVLEINPRLTRSYVGMSHALKRNIAKSVLKLLD